MHLKCEYCGYYNELKTEYLTLCEECNKKLSDNFVDWQKDNKEKSFADFKKLIGVELPQSINPKKGKRKKTLVIISIILFILIIVGGIYAKSFYLWATSKVTPEEVLKQKWVKNTYGEYKLTISTPSKLEIEKEIPAQFADNLGNIEIFKNNPTEAIQIQLINRKFSPTVIADYSSVMSRTFNRIKRQEEVTAFNHKSEEREKAGMPGILYSGVYTSDDRKFEFIGVAYGLESYVWEVLITYEAKDQVGKEVALKIIDSVSIDYNIPFYKPR